MTTAQLSKGSSRPPNAPGKYRLYSMEYCPYAQRPRIVLLVKNIPHDIVNIDLQNKPEWYFDLHPQGKVPALDTGEEVVIESLDICDFLDKKFPDPPLWPTDEERKARDKELINNLGSMGKDSITAIRDKDAKPSDDTRAYFKSLNGELEKRGTPYLGGNSPGMVDYMIWPWFEREDTHLVIHGKPSNLEEKKKTIPRLVEWKEKMYKVKAVAETAHTKEQFAEYFRRRFTKSN